MFKFIVVHITKCLFILLQGGFSGVLQFAKMQEWNPKECRKSYRRDGKELLLIIDILILCYGVSKKAAICWNQLLVLRLNYKSVFG